MNQLTSRLDNLRTLLQSKDFLEGKGLSNEVNIRIFCYDPQEEMTVKHFVSQIVTDHSLPCHLVECNLFKIFLDVCDDIGIMDAIPEMEETDGSAFLLEQLHAAIGEDEFIERIQQLTDGAYGEVLLLTGIGDVFPFMRVHKMLEALQPYFSSTPILVMYPGKYDGSSLQLFNRLVPNAYYRAFNVI